MSDNIGLFDWIDAAFRLTIGFFLGLAIGLGITLFTETNFWFALTVCVAGVLFYFGVLWLNRLSDGIFNRLFPNWALPPVRGATDQKSPLFLSRYGVLIGIIIGVLAVFILPETWLQAIL